VKNVLNYYYHLYPENIHQIGRVYTFTINNEKYYFEQLERPFEELKALYEIDIQLINKNILIHEIVLNEKKEAVTFVNNVPFILLKVYINEKQRISLSEISFINYNTSNLKFDDILKRNEWYKLWTSKIDYFEYQISQLGKNYPIIRGTFSYYIGLAETAIIYLKNANINNSQERLVVSHKRIKSRQTLYDFYNPSNIIIDTPVRDVAEYIKESFFDGKNIWNEIISFFYYNKFTLNEYILLYARLLYPSYYFDVYEKIIEGNTEEKEIIPIINKVEEYEDFLRHIYKYIKASVDIPVIDWIVNN